MKFDLKLATWLVFTIGSSYAAPLRRQTTNLRHWPPGAAEALDAMIAANAFQGNFACFDMDQTSYRYDLTESLLPFLENKGILTRETLDPSLKLIAFNDTEEYQETLFSYYYRLCDIDDKDKYSKTDSHIPTDNLCTLLSVDCTGFCGSHIVRAQNSSR